MTKIELNYALTIEEAREGIVSGARHRRNPSARSRLIGFAWQIVLGVVLIVASNSFSILAGHPTGNPEMLSLFVGYLACVLVWQGSWRKTISTVADDMVELGKISGPTTAIFDQGGVVLKTNFATARLPWVAIGKILTAKHVTILRFGAQTIILPHRALPRAVDALAFGKQLEKWRAAA